MGDTIEDNFPRDVFNFPRKIAIESLGDRVKAAILDHIVTTDGCTTEDLLKVKAVEEKTQSIIEELKNLELIRIEGDVAEVTEKGREFFNHLGEIEAYSRKGE